MNFILHGVKFHLCVSFSRAIEVIVIYKMFVQMNFKLKIFISV